MRVPANFEEHPLNANNKEILHDFVLANGNETLPNDIVEMRVNALHKFLLAHTNTRSFNDSVYLSISAECLRYEQYAKTEYYHDGSEEYRQILELYLISKEQYEELSETGSKKSSIGYYPSEKCVLSSDWLDKCSEFYFNRFESTYEWMGLTRKTSQYSCFAKDFLSCFDYVRIVCYTHI